MIFVLINSDAAMSLFHKGNTIFSISTNNGLLSFLFEMQSSAQIVDQVLDSQKTVDTRIRTTCQKLIDECASLLSRRVEQLRDHLPDIDKSPGNDTSVLASDHELDPAKNPENRHADLEDEKIKMVQQQINQMLNDLRQQVNEIRSSMSLYLCNEETESILFKPIKSKLLKSLETLEKQIRLILTSEQLAGIQSNVASWIKLATQYSS